MSNISAADVKTLREKTGAGMMDCKKALSEADGDMDKAIELLRKQGQKVSEKRAGREANEGLIVTKISDDAHKAAALELNCETDFVARNEEFQENAQQFLDLVFQNGLNSVSNLLEYNVDGITVNERLKELVGKIGEKITINRSVYIENEGSIVSYIHPGNQLGVLVTFEDDLPDLEIGRNVAMQVAAMNPVAVNRDGVDSDMIEQERQIAKDQLLNEGKPEHIAEKAAEGKLNRFYEEKVLLEQKYVKDNSLTVKQYLENNKAPLVKEFWRMQLGEEVDSQ